ncbi:MAG: hypothetical protein WCK05_03280 [Planctomycetota bacterium]
MRTYVSARRGWVVLLLTAAMTPTALRAADPIAAPGIDIPAERLTGSLLPEDKDQIKKYVKYWANKLVEAPLPKAAFDARKKLVEGYVRFASADYRYEYADVMSGEVLTGLALLAKQTGLLRTAKEVHLAQAIADMPQTKSLPALLALVANANAGLRFIGFTGLGKADLQFNVLRQGPEASAPMYAAMAATVVNEKEARVVQAALAAANLNVTPQMQGDSRLDLARMRLLQIHAKAFERLCPMVMNADPDATAALRSAVVSLGGIADDANPKQKAAMIQIALNAAYAGVTNLDPDELPGPTVGGKIKMPPASGEEAAAPAPDAPAEPEGVAAGKAKAHSVALPGSAVVKEMGVRGVYSFHVATEDFEAFKAAVEAASGAVSVEKPGLNESTALLKECDKLLVKLTNAPKPVIAPVLNLPTQKARADSVRREIQGWAKEMKQQYGLQDPRDMVKRPPAPARPASGPAQVTVDLRGGKGPSESEIAPSPAAP